RAIRATARVRRRFERTGRGLGISFDGCNGLRGVKARSAAGAHTGAQSRTEATMPRSKVLFLLADGARARFVERSPETGYFVTVQEMDGRHSLQTLRNELRASQSARTMDQNLSGGHAVGQEDFLRTAKEAFATEVAERAAALVRKRAYQGV